MRIFSTRSRSALSLRSSMARDSCMEESYTRFRVWRNPERLANSLLPSITVNRDKLLFLGGATQDTKNYETAQLPQKHLMKLHHHIASAISPREVFGPRWTGLAAAVSLSFVGIAFPVVDAATFDVNIESRSSRSTPIRITGTRSSSADSPGSILCRENRTPSTPSRIAGPRPTSWMRTADLQNLGHPGIRSAPSSPCA